MVSARPLTCPENVTKSLTMNGHLFVGDRWRIFSLRFDQGIIPNQIASVINCSHVTVFDILQLFHKTNNVIEREGRGRILLNNRKRIQDSKAVGRMTGNFMRYQWCNICYIIYFLQGNN